LPTSRCRPIRPKSAARARSQAVQASSQGPAHGQAEARPSDGPRPQQQAWSGEDAQRPGGWMVAAAAESMGFSASARMSWGR
jgi:hypothetical protein